MQDIRLDENGIVIAKGDFMIADSEEQHQYLLLKTNKGEWKENPRRGVGVVNYLETANRGELSRDIRTDFASDGMEVKRIITQGSTIEVEAIYKK